jgi:hypothetical protein
MPKVTANYEDDDCLVQFSGFRETHEEGDIIIDVTVESVEIEGEIIEFSSLDEKGQATILMLADDLEWEDSDGDDDDDGDED